MSQRKSDFSTRLSRWMATTERGQSVIYSFLAAFGIGIVAAAFAFWAAIWFSERPAFSGDVAQQQANQLSTMQLFVGLAGLMATVIALTFVLIEFTRARARPALELALLQPNSDRSSSRIDLVHHTTDHDWIRPQLAIKNHGNLTAVWFMFELEVPFLDGAISAAGLARERYHTHKDAKTAPAARYEEELRQRVREKLERGRWYPIWQPPGRAMLRFESHGEVAIYPGATTALATILVPPEAFATQRRYDCPYRLYTDRSAPVEGTLTIQVEIATPGVLVVNRRSGHQRGP